MNREEKVLKDILEKFPFLENSCRVVRPRRIAADVDYKKFENVFEYAIRFLGFNIFGMITGLDEGENLSCIYHISRSDGIMLSFKISVKREDPVIKTVIKYFPSADIYEREISDLFGIIVEGLPEGKRYPLSDDWPKGEYPLRKDWKCSSPTLTGENKNA